MRVAILAACLAMVLLGCTAEPQCVRGAERVDGRCRFDAGTHDSSLEDAGEDTADAPSDSVPPCDASTCDGRCVDLMTDPRHCGDCDRACEWSCVGGVCDDPVDVAAGWLHSCALLVSGRMACWGDNSRGQLGDGTKEDRTQPVLVLDLRDIVEAAPGGQHTCARRVSGRVLCWGNALDGSGSMDAHTAPRSEVAGLDDAVQISVGDRHTCARRATGQVVCWGQNTVGQLGDGTLEARATPVDVVGLSDAVEIAAGNGVTCARRRSGDVTCWGQNDAGELGDGTMMSRSTPTASVAMLTDAESIATTGQHSCARLPDSRAACWGLNHRGQLGNGMVTAPASTRVFVSGLVDIVELAPGAEHTCARRAFGQVACWGANDMGQLGDALMTDRALPGNVPGLTEVEQLTSGFYHACARRRGGEIVCWGANEHGQLGDGTLVHRTTPVRVQPP